MGNYTQEEVEKLLDENIKLEKEIKDLKNENQELQLRIDENKEYEELFKQLKLLLEDKKLDTDKLLKKVEQEVLKFVDENTLYSSKDVKNLLQKTNQKIDELKTENEKLLLQEIQNIKQSNKNYAKQIIEIIVKKLENKNCEISNADLFLYLVGILTTGVGVIAIIKNLFF